MVNRRLLSILFASTSMVMMPLGANAAVPWNDGLYVCRPEVAGPRAFHVRFTSNDDGVTSATVPEDQNMAGEVVRNGKGWEWGTGSDVRYYVFSSLQTRLEVETRTNGAGVFRHFMCDRTD